MSAGRCGATAVLDGDKVVGIITDGDLRRHLERSRSQIVTASDLMNASPKLMHSSDLAVKAFQILEQNAISQVIITEDEQYVGMVHLHDILREGIF